MVMKRIRLGEILLNAGLINQETLDQAMELQKKTGDKFGRILINMGVVSEHDVLELFAKQLNIPYIDLDKYELSPEYTHLLPETYARRCRALVLGEKDGELLVGMADPQDITAFDAISKVLKKPLKLAVISEMSLLNAIDRIYRRTQEISTFAHELSGEMIEELSGKEDELFDELQESDEQAPVVKLLNSLFHDAVQARASDIHIEPDEKSLRIRFRIDGQLHENILDEKRIVSALIQRLKLRAHLDISEKRIPQDGRFNFKIKGNSFDVRLSTLPTANGEAVVMRLLNQSSEVTDLSQLGIDPETVKRIEEIYSKPYGMLLVTGPTGSGKTTTLYSILARLNLPERKIITVEDPIEYRISRINQVQVNPKIDLTFARVLRAMLRQDPDVIMVGEIRDPETAQIAMRAAVTGHLVLATLHTNDAMTSAIRLIDMGVEGYMVASAVKAIIGQRLVRTLCKFCIYTEKPDEHELIWLLSMKVDPKLSFKKGVGCSHCNYSGYYGRVGIYELLELNTDMLNALRQNDSAAFVKAALACKTYHPLSESVLELVKDGTTSIAEAIRVVGQLDEEFLRRETEPPSKNEELNQEKG
ncbi:Flp pilus assembly complex ATPase component TadA [Legionella sp. 27fs60]|uniref:Flp pilus assembly complex ATPase component TadA n=2 Tax=Legionella bononiensis TaxID=2793102 RepID=A0ABS1WBE5_9GAMM|nr:Flp pilus assembly complex ATPase component TadA [Legionella bononiensis]MBL7526668.1 Flp pilus assembly complex ATPase component TadA [Legionella bononiensis]